MAELKLHCAGPYRAQGFCEIPGVPALEKQRFHPWLTCGHAVGVLLSGPGTDELIVPNGLSPDYYPTITFGRPGLSRTSNSDWHRHKYGLVP
jgi:hypothetical protein